MGRENWALYLFELPLEEEIALMAERSPGDAEELAPIMRDFEEWLPTVPGLSDEQIFDQARSIYRDSGLGSFRMFLTTYLWLRVTRTIGDALNRCRESGYIKASIEEESRG